MHITSTKIPEVKILEPKFFADDRGFFLESYNQRVIHELLQFEGSFVQDNHSFSKKNVLRGLHYQIQNPQGKLVRAVSGEIFDVAVDLRKSSATFGKWVGFHLSEKNKKIAWIPPGFAHGFLVLSESADVLYKATAFYDPPSDRSLLWNDPEISIEWPLQAKPLLSPKDAAGKLLRLADVFQV